MATLAELKGLLSQEDPAASRQLQELEDFEASPWVTVFRDESAEDSESYVLACLLDEDLVQNALHRPSFDLLSGHGRPGFVATGNSSGGWDAEYLTVGADGVIPLVFHRYSQGDLPDSVELAEDFRLFWDLFEEADRGRFVLVDETGEAKSVAEWHGSELRVRKRYLRRYQAARQLSLSLQVEVTRRAGAAIAHLADSSHEVNESGYVLTYYGGSGLSEPSHNFTRLLGKRVLPPPPVEESDLWPYESEREFESFIISADAEGRPLEHTSNPETLANYFGKNPTAPHYLTPVFFERAVLDRYYRDTDRYRIEDGYLGASGAWGLRMDNALEDRVAVFLGDLGSDLPIREQRHWKAYNVEPEGAMSDTALARSFLGAWVDSTRIEQRFLSSYKSLNDCWSDVHGWPLFLPLHESDSHVSDALHVPTNSSFGQFDEQIVRLAKLTVDSLNESAIAAALGTAPPGGVKGIGKLELLFVELGLVDPGVCALMRVVQGIRSRSAAHRKASDFDLALLLDGSADLSDRFRRMLEEYIAHFEAIVSALRN